MSKFIESAGSRETSTSIMEAILHIATDESHANEIWEAPSDQQLIAIWERATKDGLVPDGELFWGAAGNQWAAEIAS